MKDAEVSLDYFVNGDTWEVGLGVTDEIRIWVEIDGGSSAGGSDIYLLNTNGADIDSLNIEEKWTTLALLVSALAMFACVKIRGR